jgi:glycosyltransferase involved in cell wall biosynthesis
MTTASSGGAEFAAVNMLDALAERGHDVVMLSNRADIGRDTRVPVVALDIGPKLSSGSWRSLILSWAPYVRRLAKALDAQYPYDVLILHYKKEQLMASMLPSRLRSTLVWKEWGPVPYPLRSGFPRRAYVAAARRVSIVMAVSEGTRKSVREVGVPAEKIVVVPNVVDVEEIQYRERGRAEIRKQLGIPQDAFVVGCLSRLHPKKRNDVVVQALELLGDPRAHLIMAGSGETEAELRSLAAPLGPRAHFIPTPGEEVADVLSAFDVSVFCPSPTEGAPLATILGMLTERACLATGPEGVADMIVPGRGAIANPINDPESLTALLREYHGDPERRAREGAAGRFWAVSMFSRPVVTKQIEDLLAQVGARS